MYDINVNCQNVGFFFTFKRNITYNYLFACSSNAIKETGEHKSEEKALPLIAASNIKIDDIESILSHLHGK